MREWTYPQRLFLDLAAQHKRVLLEEVRAQQERERELEALEQKYAGGP